MVSFYFVTILMPVVVATSFFFNRVLVPRYLLKKKTLKFFTYFFYMLICSIYLELLVMVLAFVVLADYKIENLGKIAGDVYLLTVLLYLVVLVEGLILSIRKLRDQSAELIKIKSKVETESQTEISIRSNRKNVILNLSEIVFIESLGDYVKVHALSSTHITKEKISSLEERLPSDFIRTHRSFIIHKPHVTEFNKEGIRMDTQVIPIGRKFKKRTEEQLTKSAIV